MSGAISSVFAQTPLDAKVLDPWAGIRNYNSAIASQYAPAQAFFSAGKTAAEIPETQARAGLIGQQAIGAGIQNQLVQQRIANLQRFGQPNTSSGSSYPDEQEQPAAAGAPAAPHGNVAPATGFPMRDPNTPPGAPAIGAGSAAPPAAPDLSQPGPALSGGGWSGPPGPQAANAGINAYATTSEPGNPTDVGAPAIGGGTQVAQGGAPSGGAIGGAASSRQPVTTGANGVYAPEFGIGSMPQAGFFAIQQAMLNGGDVQGTIHKVLEDKRAAIGQLIQQTVDPNDPTGKTHNPVLWRQAVRHAYDTGLIDSSQEVQFYNHPDRAPQFFSQAVGATETPEYKQAAAAAAATGTKQGEIPYQNFEVGVKTGPGTYQKMQVQYNRDGSLRPVGTPDGTQLPGVAMGQPTASSQQPSAAGGAPMDAADYTKAVIGSEGGAGTGQRPNASGPDGTSTSSAAGGAQFLDKTWVGQMRETYPDWSKQFNDDQLLALRSNDRVSQQLTMDYANHNAPILSAAGLPVTASTLKLAHGFGPDGAASILKAAPNTPIGQVVGAGVMAANPTLAGKTAGQVVQQYRQPFGDNADQPVRGVVGAVQQPGQTAADGGASVPVGTVGAGKPELTPQGTADLAVQTASRTKTAELGAEAKFKIVDIEQPVLDSNGTRTGTQKVQMRQDPDTGALYPLTAVPGTAAGGAAGVAGPANTLGAGNPELTPGAAAALDVQKNQQIAENNARAEELKGESEGYAKESGAIIAAQYAAPNALQRLDTLANAADAFRPGSSGPARAKAMAWLVDAIQTAGGKAPDWMVNGGTGSELISKEGGFLGFQMARFLGSREAASVVQQAMQLQPNLSLTQGGYNALLTAIRQGIKRDQDIGTYREQWLDDTSHHNSIRGMQDAFNQTHPVQAYASRVIPYPFPKSQSDAIPNVIYRVAPGSKAAADGAKSLIWNGQQFLKVN